MAQKPIQYQSNFCNLATESRPFERKQQTTTRLIEANLTEFEKCSMLSALFFTSIEEEKLMRITADQKIAGHPAIAVRNFLRKHELIGFIAESAQASLSMSPQDANAFLNKLVDLGLLKKSNRWNGFDLTDCGVRLAYASAAKPIHRKTADRLLSEFMERVHTVNATAEYLFWVSEAILFGSMLSDDKRLGDVDVAVTLESKAKDFTEFCEWSWERRRAAEVKGRSFPTIVEQACWPREEVCKLLKARSIGLSLHELSNVKLLPNLSYRILLGDAERLAALMPTGRAI